MTQYNTLNVTLSYSKLNTNGIAIKNGTEVTLNLSSNLIGSSNNETNLPHKLLLTNTQILKIRKAFPNGLSAKKKFSKTQLSKFVQSVGFIDALDLIKNLHKNPFFNPDKTVVTINDIIKAATDSKNFIKIFKNVSDNVYGTGITLTDNEIKDIIKVSKVLGNRGISLKGTTRKRRTIFNFYLTISGSWFTIKEKCNYSIT